MEDLRVLEAITHAIRAAELRRRDQDATIKGLAVLADRHSAASSRALTKMCGGLALAGRLRDV